MVRKLKHHEKKLLKKVDFIKWKNDSTFKENQVLRRYHIDKRNDYEMYNKLCGKIRSLANHLSLLDPNEPFRIKMTDELLEKLTNMGILPTDDSLSQAFKVTVSSFCRRRLAVIVMKLKMCESVKQATKLIEQGHVRVGPDVATDPAFLVTRQMEDFVTWVDSSKIKRHVYKYNDELDDYDLA